MSTYNPQGKPHLFLERLADGELSFVALAEQMAGGTMAARKRKTFHTLSSMLADGLIAGNRASYVITQAGVDALHGLRAGKPVAMPSKNPGAMGTPGPVAATSAETGGGRTPAAFAKRR